MDGWIEGPGLPQSVWRYKWLVGAFVVLGILLGVLLSVTQPTRYEGVVRIYLTTDEVASGDTERIVLNHAQFIESPTVADRVLALVGNRLTRKELQDRLTVEPSADADFITIRALDTTPTNAAALADAVDLAYRQILTEQSAAAANQRIKALEDVQARLANELAQIRREQRNLDSPALQAAEQAKRREMEATANKIEEVSADTAGSPPVLQDKAAVPDEPAQPKPLLAGAIGAVVGLAIGVAVAWLLAARRRARRSEDTAASQAHIVDDRDELGGVSHDLIAHQRTSVPPSPEESDVGVTSSEIQESPRQIQFADVGHNRETESVGDAVNSLDKDPDLLYSLAEWLESQHQNFPQITAERLRDRLLFDKVAVLLKTDGGLDLAGCVGWHPDRARRVRPDERRIVNRLAGNGVRQIGSADRRALVNAGLIGNEAQPIVVAPLKHENVAFGVLLVGQSDSEAPTNGSFNAIGSFARSVAPDLHAWLLLHKLREQLASHGKTQVHTTSSAVSAAPSAEPAPPTAESQPAPPTAASQPAPPTAESQPAPPTAASQPTPAKPTPPTAESASPPSESAPPTAKSSRQTSKTARQIAKSASPPRKSAPLPAESAPPAAESQPPSAEPQPPAAEPQPSAAEPQPPAAEPQPSAAEPQPPAAEPQPSAAEPQPPFAWPTYPVESEPSSAA